MTEWVCSMLQCQADVDRQLFRYRMPLLHIVGVTPTTQTVSLSFAFLSEECEKDYTRALRQFHDCFMQLLNDGKITVVVDRELALIAGIKAALPQATVLICLWHINKNVQANSKQHF